MTNRITDVSAYVKATDISFGAQMAKTRRDLEQTVGVAENASTRMRGVDLFGGIVPTFDVGSAIMGSANLIGNAVRQIEADLQRIDTRAQDAEGLGFTYEQMRAIEVAATLADIPVDRLSNTFARFLKTVAMAGEGSKEAEKDLARLGLTVKDFEGLTSWQAIEKVADRISELPSPAERAAASMEIFGREAGLKMVAVLGEGSAALDGYLNKARELGLVLDEELIGKAKMAADALDFRDMRRTAAREQRSAQLAETGFAETAKVVAGTWEFLIDDMFAKAALRMDSNLKATSAWFAGLKQGRGLNLDDLRDASRSGFTGSGGPRLDMDTPAIVQAEDEAKKLEGIYDQIEEEQKKSAERIAAWRQQVREQELEKEYRDIGKQIEREEKERMEAERKMADEAEKMAREVSRVRDRAGRDAANAWDSSGGGMAAAPLAVMGTAEQQLASYQASRARGNAEMRAEFIERAVEAALRKITVKTEVVQGGISAAPV